MSAGITLAASGALDLPEVMRDAEPGARFIVRLEIPGVCPPTANPIPADAGVFSASNIADWIEDVSFRQEHLPAVLAAVARRLRGMDDDERNSVLREAALKEKSRVASALRSKSD